MTIFGAVYGVAQDATRGTPKAKAAFEKGETARKTGDLKAAADDYKLAVELDPAYTEAHEQYIMVSQDVATHDVYSAVISGKASAEQEAQFKKEKDEANARLQTEYSKWAKEHPDKAGYQWALGFLNDYKDPKGAIRYYQAALKTNPKFAPGYASLSLMDEVQGDLAGMRENLHKAVEADPADPSYLFNYAYAVHLHDPAESNRLFLEVVKRFPASRQVAQALFELAENAPAETDKIRYLEMLKNDHYPAAQDWKGGGMMMLFNIYERTDRAKALAIAQEMVKTGSENDEWQPLAAYAQAMVQADQFIKQGKPEDAVKALDKVTLPKWYHTSQLVLMRARALSAAGQKQNAYETLLEADASSPSDDIHSLLLQYGQDLSKNDHQIDADVQQLQVKNSRPAIPFSLGTYTNQSQASLADFRGHVILLNFWYPECGPCRGEFPYIQAVLDKYKDQGFEIVAVNVEREEDDFVMPLLKGFGLGFIPLKGNDTITHTYHVRGEPTNFLIGADGRIYFGPLAPVSSPEAQRTLELQVAALLQAHQAATN
jgi:tetratricopeptide (TPR) repeat protein